MRLIRALFFTLLLGLTILGQTNRGGISGTVTDSTGAAIPGAKVTVTSLGTNQSITLTTSGDGTFSANSLEPVKYTVVVEATNFKTSIISEVKVDTATTQSVNVMLETGNITERVTITADAPLLNTESGTTGKTISERQLEDVPLSNRSVLDLATTVPNVSGDVGSEDPEVTSGVPAPGFNLSINGGRPGSTTILADGTNNTGVGIARQVVSFTPETVQEFTVQTSAYSAEYGQTAGGVINATTKAGTNNFNGTALWYHRDPSLNAKKWGNGAVRPNNNLRTDQVSFTVGGPVFLPAFGEGGPHFYNGRNRTFFFAAVEPRWRKDFLVVDTLLPTAAERAGDFRGLVRTSSGFLPAGVASQFGLVPTGTVAIYNQFVQVGNQFQRLPVPPSGQRYCQFGETTTIAGSNYCSTSVAIQDARNVIPSNLIDPMALKILQYMPAGGNYYLNGSGGVSNYLVNRFVVQNEIRYTARIDHNFTSNNRANFRYTKVPAVGEKGFGSEVNGNGASYSDSSQMVFTDNHIFSPKFINELRLGYTTGTFSDDFSKKYSINGGENLATELGLPSITEGGLPLFLISSDGSGYNAFANIGSSGSTNNYNREKRYTLTDIFYWNQGNKTWKFGVDIGSAYLNVTPFFAASGGRYDFRTGTTSQDQTNNNVARGGDPLASLLLGVANSVAIRSLLINYTYNWKSYAGFVQNDWKIRPNLTLNLGVRYSVATPRTEENNLQGTYMPELAKTYTLPTPVTLPTGTVVTTALVPPFAYSGRGGRSRYLFPIDFGNVEPRFGFAWSPKSIFGWGKEGETVIRGGYGISHAPLTGNNRLPLPDLGSFNVNAATQTATGSTGTVNTSFVPRLSYNQPVNGLSLLDRTPAEIEKALGIPADGLDYLGSLAIPGFTIIGKPKTPYVQNWNLSISKQIMKNTVVELAYVGNKGTHLFLPFVNVNPRDFNYVQQLDLLGSATDTNTTDPLRRLSLIGTTLSVPTASLGSKYLGFDTLNSFYDTSGNSIRHAGYVDIRRRITNGLAFTANYTYGKSMDDASDASPDKNILTSGNTAGSNYTFGAPRYTDRAVSTYDVKHAFSSTFIWDLPFGRKRAFFSNAWAPVDAVFGGWTMSGVFRLMSGYPFLPTIADGNTIGTATHSIRPDLVLGVPLINPLYDPGCKASTLCEPYVNPAAFMRPVKGGLGNAPRTMDIRGPMLKYFDVSFQKNFNMPFGWDNDGKRRIQLRVDLINAFNMPNYRINSTNSGSSVDFIGAPVETAVTLAEYNAWAAFNGKPLAASASDPAYIAAANVRPGGTTGGVLPLNFFNIPVPQGFATANPYSFDITTLQGFKLFRLKNAYGANGSNFGQLRELGNPRYVQLGLKIYF